MLALQRGNRPNPTGALGDRHLPHDAELMLAVASPSRRELVVAQGTRRKGFHPLSGVDKDGLGHLPWQDCGQFLLLPDCPQALRKLPTRAQHQQLQDQAPNAVQWRLCLETLVQPRSNTMCSKLGAYLHPRLSSNTHPLQHSHRHAPQTHVPPQTQAASQTCAHTHAPHVPPDTHAPPPDTRPQTPPLKISLQESSVIIEA